MKTYSLPWVWDARKWFPSARLIRTWAFGKAYFMEMDHREYIILDESILGELYDCDDDCDEDDKPALISLLEFDGEKERDEYISTCLNFADHGPDAWRIITPSSREQDQETRLGSLVSLKSVRRVMIRDDWDDLSWKTPVERQYCIRRREDSFSLSCLFGAGEPGCFQRFNIDSSHIPQNTMEEILAKLEGIQIRRGNYVPRVFKRYESTNLGIYMDTGDDRIVFSTESQGRYHKPWGVRVAGKGYVYRGRQIARALRELRPFLKLATFSRLCQGVKVLSRPFWET